VGGGGGGIRCLSPSTSKEWDASKPEMLVMPALLILLSCRWSSQRCFGGDLFCRHVDFISKATDNDLYWYTVL
jgi:hypothetical protein